MIILCLLLSVASITLGIASYITGMNTQTRLDSIYGVYPSVKAASTASVLGRLSLRTMLETKVTDIDGVRINSGDRVLFKNELNPQLNGIYVNSNGEFVRSTDMSHNYQIVPGISIYVESGSVNSCASFRLARLATGSSVDPVTGYGIAFDRV